jgi:hypothetical protein
MLNAATADLLLLEMNRRISPIKIILFSEKDFVRLQD